MTRRKMLNFFTNPLALIIMTAVILRVAASLMLGNTIETLPAIADQISYHSLATRFLEGHGFTFAVAWWPATRAGEATAHWSYLYTLYLSLIYSIFGLNPLAARLIQSVLAGILMPWLAFRLARQVFKPRQGLSPQLPNQPKDTPSQPLPKGEGNDPNHDEIHIRPRFTSMKTLALSWQSADTIIPLLAAAWIAVYGYFIYFSAALMTETFYIIGILWVLDCALRLGIPRERQEHNPGSRASLNKAFFITPWIEMGLSISITAMLRQVFLLFVPVLFLWLGWTMIRQGNRQTHPANNSESRKILNSPGAKASKRFISFSLLTILVITVLIAPITIYNYAQFNRFVLLNTNAGYAFYWSNHPIYGDRFVSILTADMPSYYELLPQDVLWMNEAQLDNELMKRGIAFVTADLGRYIRLSIDRIPAYFIFWPLDSSSTFSNITRVFSYGLAIPFIIVGIILWINDIRRRRIFADAGLLLLLFSMVYSIVHLLSWAGIRYRLPVDAVTLTFAARGLYELGRWILIRR